MKGAIVGDIVGSVYEWNNIKTKYFPLFREDCFFTDDTVMTVAIGHALMNNLGFDGYSITELVNSLTSYMQMYGRKYQHRGYGGAFAGWIYDKDPKPYYSFGNGAPMRASSAGWLAKSAEEARELGRITALPTHNHPEGLKAASLAAELIWMARNGESMDTLRTRAAHLYALPVIDEIRSDYTFDVSSQGTMPVALSAFFESTSFEDAIRNAISVGGDSDTIAAITGSIAEAYYGVSEEIWNKAKHILNSHLVGIVDKFYNRTKDIQSS